MHAFIKAHLRQGKGHQWLGKMSVVPILVKGIKGMLSFHRAKHFCSDKVDKIASSSTRIVTLTDERKAIYSRGKRNDHHIHTYVFIIMPFSIYSKPHVRFCQFSRHDKWRCHSAVFTETGRDNDETVHSYDRECSNGVREMRAWS